MTRPFLAKERPLKKHIIAINVMYMYAKNVRGLKMIYFMSTQIRHFRTKLIIFSLR